MNWRNSVYLSYASCRGYRFPAYLKQYRADLTARPCGEIATSALSQLLRHCRGAVPYYSALLQKAGYDDAEGSDATEILSRLPVLTKQLIRNCGDQLHSFDLGMRKWCKNTSGGSTGEPICLVQDSDYEDRSGAITLLMLARLGYETGAPLVRLWGSERDIESGTRSPKARFFNWLTNTTWLNAFCMSPERMRQYADTLNQLKPRLIVAYAQAAYELAKFIERESIPVVPQRAVLTSAGTLYPFMREKISQVFNCKVYNLYGSREVSDIACELPHTEGLWVPPWGNYVEILDDGGRPVPAGEEGNIVVTNLVNYAMPLVRYLIGDRGALLPETGGSGAQFLKTVTGRNVDAFRTRGQTLIDGEYFTHLLYFRPWVWKFQVVQRNLDEVLFKVVRTDCEPPQTDLEEITRKARLVMGPECKVHFEFLPELPPHPSGKFRYTISEVAA